MSKKTENLNKIFLIVVLLASILIMFISENKMLRSFGTAILIGSFAGIVTLFSLSYIKPSPGLFKIRYFLYGIGNGLFLAILALPSEITDNRIPLYVSIGFSLLMGMVFGIPATMIFAANSFNKLRKKTALTPLPEETGLLTDKAVYWYQDVKIRGRLILTNKRLCFRSDKMDLSSHDVDLTVLNPEFENILLFGFPLGFSIKGTSMTVKVNFPKYWKEEIRKVADFHVSKSV